MWKNERLEQICDNISYFQPDWERIRRKFLRIPFNCELRNLEFYTNIFSELYLSSMLEDLEDKKQGVKYFRYKVPMTNGLSIKCTPTGGITMVENGGRHVVEYDGLILIEDNPVIFEIKIVKLKRTRNINERIWRFLRKKEHEKKIYFINEFFNKDSGFVLAVPTDIYLPLEQSSKCGSIFMQENGIFIPIYTTSEGFHEDVVSVLRDLHIPAVSHK